MGCCKLVLIQTAAAVNYITWETDLLSAVQQLDLQSTLIRVSASQSLTVCVQCLCRYAMSMCAGNVYVYYVYYAYANRHV